jgi:hypothetical protein
MLDRLFRTTGRKAALATVAVMALTAAAPSASFARGGRHWHGGGGAAAAAAFAGIIGTGLAIAAAQNRDAYAYDGYYEGPAYYGGPVNYGDGYYGHRSSYPYQGYIGRDPYAHCSRSGANCW